MDPSPALEPNRDRPPVSAIGAYLLPLEVKLTPGQRHESTITEYMIDFIDFISGTACLADGGYDATRIINDLKERGINPVIPPSRNRKTQRCYDKQLYQQRYLVQVCFHNIKRIRRIATRYDTTSSCYLTFVQIGCVLQWIL